MGMFSRFYNIVRAQVNQWLNAAEDPSAMLNQMIEDLEGQKRQAKEQVSHALADQKKLERDLRKEEEQVQKWEQKAILAVQKEEDELAKEALMRKKEHQRYVSEFGQQLEQHQKNTEMLRESYSQLERKIEEVKRKKGVLLAKHKQAEAQQALHKTMEGFDGTGALETIERMEEKIDDMQDKAEAYKELSDEGKDSLERKFESLGDGDADVDQELLALKQRALLESKA